MLNGFPIEGLQSSKWLAQPPARRSKLLKGARNRKHVTVVDTSMEANTYKWRPASCEAKGCVAVWAHKQKIVSMPFCCNYSSRKTCICAFWEMSLNSFGCEWWLATREVKIMHGNDKMFLHLPEIKYCEHTKYLLRSAARTFSAISKSDSPWLKAASNRVLLHSWECTLRISKNKESPTLLFSFCPLWCSKRMIPHLLETAQPLNCQ